MSSSADDLAIWNWTLKRIDQWGLANQGSLSRSLEIVAEDSRSFWPTWLMTRSGKRRIAFDVFKMFLQPQIDNAVLDYLFDAGDGNQVGLRRGFLERDLGKVYKSAGEDKLQMAHWLLKSDINGRFFKLPPAPLRSLVLPRIEQARFLCFRGWWALNLAVEQLIRLDKNQAGNEPELFIDDIRDDEHERIQSILNQRLRTENDKFLLEFLYERVDPLNEAKYVALATFGLPLEFVENQERKREKGIFLDEKGDAVFAVRTVDGNYSTSRATLEHVRKWLSGIARVTAFELTGRKELSISEPLGDGQISDRLESSELEPIDNLILKEKQELNDEQFFAKGSLNYAKKIINLPDHREPLRKSFILKSLFGGLPGHSRTHELTLAETGLVLSNSSTSSVDRLLKKAKKAIAGEKDEGVAEAKFFETVALVLVLLSNSKRKGLYHCWVRNDATEKSLSSLANTQRLEKFRILFVSETRQSCREFLEISAGFAQALTLDDNTLVRDNPILREVVEFVRKIVLDDIEENEKEQVWADFVSEVDVGIKNRAPLEDENA